MLSTSFDSEADALYITLRRGASIARTDELDDGTLVDVDALGSAVGIEVIHPARAWPVEEFLERYRIMGKNRELLLQMFSSAGGLTPFSGSGTAVTATSTTPIAISC
ncbi:MAG TPA: DUF2283 domain-containing protein [Micromonosporaceae bacterium]|nr:DUF2283 domain-containing protein [Micromonosporaceae bacterium]